MILLETSGSFSWIPAKAVTVKGNPRLLHHFWGRKALQRLQRLYPSVFTTFWTSEIHISPLTLPFANLYVPFSTFPPSSLTLGKLPSHCFFERKNTEISRKVVMKLLTTWFSPPAERVEIMVPLTHGIVNPSWPRCGPGSLPCCLVEDWKSWGICSIYLQTTGGERWDLKGFCNDLWLPQERDGNFIGFMWNQCVRLLVLEDRNVEAISIVVCFGGAMAYRHTSCSFRQTMNAFWTPLFDFAPFMVEYPNGCTSFEDELAY